MKTKSIATDAKDGRHGTKKPRLFAGALNQSSLAGFTFFASLHRLDGANPLLLGGVLLLRGRGGRKAKGGGRRAGSGGHGADGVAATRVA
jgi:hypothetical protein